MQLYRSLSGLAIESSYHVTCRPTTWTQLQLHSYLLNSESSDMQLIASYFKTCIPVYMQLCCIRVHLLTSTWHCMVALLECFISLLIFMINFLYLVCMCLHINFHLWTYITSYIAMCVIVIAIIIQLASSTHMYAHAHMHSCQLLSSRIWMWLLFNWILFHHACMVAVYSCITSADHFAHARNICINVLRCIQPASRLQYCSSLYR